MPIKNLSKTLVNTGTVLAVGLLAACTSPPPADDPAGRVAYYETNDPYEPYNRYMFEVNLFLDEMLLRPLSHAYRDGMPEYVQDRVHNFLFNLREPVTFVNNVMQGKGERAWVTAQRFGINSTIGVGGLWDQADDNFELPPHKEDFGQTLAVSAWQPSLSPEEGPYLVLPLFGPSNPRDAIGLGVDTLMDPFTYLLPTGAGFGRTGGEALDKRSRNLDTLDEIERTSVDFYATIRSLYRQRRADEIRDGEDSGNLPAPSISIEFDNVDDEQPAEAQQ